MKNIFPARTAFFFRIIFFFTMAFRIQPVTAQMSTVVYSVISDCINTKDPRNNLENVWVVVYLDSKSIRSTGGLLAEGGHYLRATVEPKENNGDNFTISKIEWFKCAAGVYGEPKNEVSQTFNSKEATMIVNVEKFEEKSHCYKAVIYIERCGQPKEAKIKVITTKSVYKSEPEPTSDIEVLIGDHQVSIDKDGIGFIKFKPGKYVLNILGKEGIIAYPDGLSIKTTKNNSTTPLTRIPNSLEYIDEYNLNLSEENSGTGSLYDFEVRVNMKITPRGGHNEVRVVAVKPDVQVHKASTPEDSWMTVVKDMVLQEGDEISCDPDGAATLQFADNSTVVIKNTTQLKIASFFTEGGVVKTEILLKMGEVAAKVHKSEATKSDFRIKPPSGPGSVRGTTFSMKYEPTTQTTTIKVEEGIVDFTPEQAKSSKITLNTGQQVRIEGSTVGPVMSFKEKIDFTLTETNNPKINGNKDDTKISVSDPHSDLTGTWLITQGTNTGTLTIVQNEKKLSGQVKWNNGQQGVIESGDFLLGYILFAISYESGLKEYNNANLDGSGMKMIGGKGLSNKGVETTWSALRQ